MSGPRIELSPGEKIPVESMHPGAALEIYPKLLGRASAPSILRYAGQVTAAVQNTAVAYRVLSSPQASDMNPPAPEVFRWYPAMCWSVHGDPQPPFPMNPDDKIIQVTWKGPAATDLRWVTYGEAMQNFRRMKGVDVA